MNAVAPAHKAWFRSERLFYNSDLSGSAGWYYQTREDGVVGPYDTRTMAEEALWDFVLDCQFRNDTGGR